MMQKLVKLKKQLINKYKYIITSKFNHLIVKNFAARLPQVNLVTKTDFGTRVVSLNKKINSSITKHLLVKNEFKKTTNI